MGRLLAYFDPMSRPALSMHLTCESQMSSMLRPRKNSRLKPAAHNRTITHKSPERNGIQIVFLESE